MEQISKLFTLFAWLAGVVVILGIIATVFYFRWRAAGQERGI